MNKLFVSLPNSLVAWITWSQWSSSIFGKDRYVYGASRAIVSRKWLRLVIVATFCLAEVGSTSFLLLLFLG